MGKESDFSRRVRKTIKSSGGQCYPIESGNTGVGLPDLLVLHEGGPSLVELKSRPAMLLSRLADTRLEGPGQRAFAKVMARKCSVSVHGARVYERSFLLVECMDGVALFVEEETGAWQAACWEGMPSGGDLLGALRAWRAGVVPQADMGQDELARVYVSCARVYEHVTGIHVHESGWDSLRMTLNEDGGRERAIKVSRDICDMGRYQLLMKSIRDKDTGSYLAPIEGGGYVKMVKGD